MFWRQLALIDDELQVAVGCTPVSVVRIDLADVAGIAIALVFRPDRSGAHHDEADIRSGQRGCEEERWEQERTRSA